MVYYDTLMCIIILLHYIIAITINIIIMHAKILIKETNKYVLQ